MTEMSLTVVDVAVAAIVLISALFAMWRGLVGEAFRIVDWAAATYVAIRFTPAFQPLLRETISPAWLEYTVVFIGTFLVMFIPLSMLNHRIAESVRKSEIGPVDRVLGFLFGVARGLAVVGLAYILFTVFVPVDRQPETLTKARVYPIVQKTAVVLLEIVPSKPQIAGLTGGAPAPAGSSPPRQAEATPPAASNAPAYGAGERSALDKLIETTGADQVQKR